MELARATAGLMAFMDVSVICLGYQIHTNKAVACHSRSLEPSIKLSFEKSMDGREPLRENASRSLQSLQNFRT